MSVFNKWIAVFAFLSSVFSYVGIHAIYKNSKWIDKLKDYLLCFAAGVLIATPFLVAFPHSFEKDEKSGIFAVIGFIFMLFIDKIVYKLTNDKKEAFGLTGAIAIGFHSFVDGVIYTITFNASVIIGFLSATGLVAHEFAEGVITYTFLVAGGYNAKKAFWYAFIIAGLTTPFGAFIVYPLIGSVSRDIIPRLVSLVGGMLVYFSASHLIPEARDSQEKHSVISFLIGVGLAFIFSLHTHH